MLMETTRIAREGGTPAIQRFEQEAKYKRTTEEDELPSFEFYFLPWEVWCHLHQMVVSHVDGSLSVVATVS